MCNQEDALTMVFVCWNQKQLRWHTEVTGGIVFSLHIRLSVRGLRKTMNNQNQKEEIIVKLRSRNYRITNQRKILLDIILEGEYTSCKEIYYKATKVDPAIGMATIYRMINTLEEIGVISRGLRRLH